MFRLFFRQIQTCNDKCRFFVGVNTFWVVQNNRPVIDAMNGLNKRRKATSVSIFDVSTLYTKLPHNRLLMVRLISILMEEKVNILQLIIMEPAG